MSVYPGEGRVHYGSRSQRGTEVAALFYSIIETAKLVDADPFDYMQRAAEAALRGESIPLPGDPTPNLAA